MRESEYIHSTFVAYFWIKAAMILHHLLHIAAMRNKLLQITLCLLIAYTSPAQHTDRIELDELADGAIHNGLDEINHPGGSVESAKPVAGLSKELPFFKKGYTFIRTKLTGNRSLLSAIEVGKLVYSVELRRNKMHGKWTSRYSNGQLLDSGLFNKNIPDGEWISMYANGQIRSIRNFSASKWFMVQNHIYRFNSKTTTNYLARMALKRDGSFDAITLSSHSFAHLASSNEPYTPPFAHCVHHGLYMNYYSNGAVKDSGFYKDGLRDGLWTEFFENSQLSASGSYFKGQKNGGWKYFNLKGKLVALAEYQQGKLVFRKQY